jgi:hypothetical protein
MLAQYNVSLINNMNNITSTITVANLFALLTVWIAYHVARGSYYISPWHPLHHIPGPKPAAASLLYGFWYDMILGGTYTKQIKKMHAIYGTSCIAT